MSAILGKLAQSTRKDVARAVEGPIDPLAGARLAGVHPRTLASRSESWW